MAPSLFRTSCNTCAISCCLVSLGVDSVDAEVTGVKSGFCDTDWTPVLLGARDVGAEEIVADLILAELFELSS